MTATLDDLDERLQPVLLYRHRLRHGGSWPTHKGRQRRRRRRYSSLRRTRRSDLTTTDDTRRSTWN